LSKAFLLKRAGWARKLGSGLVFRLERVGHVDQEHDVGTFVLIVVVLVVVEIRILELGLLLVGRCPDAERRFRGGEYLLALENR